MGSCLLSVDQEGQLCGGLVRMKDLIFVDEFIVLMFVLEGILLIFYGNVFG